MVEDRVSKRIKALLKDYGLTQAHLAHKLGITVQYLSRLLQAGAGSSKYLSSIARALDVTPEYLLTGNSKPVLLVDDEHLKILVRSNFELTDDHKAQALNLLVKSNSGNFFFAYELKISIDEIIQSGSIIVFCSKIPTIKKEGDIFIVCSKVSQAFIAGKYSLKNNSLNNLNGHYQIQANDTFVGYAAQMIIYLNSSD